MGYLMASLLIFLSVLCPIICNIIASELYDRAPSIADWIINHEANHLPIDVQDRYREEWMAHFDECPGKLSKLIQAMWIGLAACRLSAEFLRQINNYKDEQGSDNGDPTPSQLMLVMAGTPIMLATVVPDTLDCFHSNNWVVRMVPILAWWLPGLLNLWLAVKLLMLKLRRPKPEI